MDTDRVHLQLLALTKIIFMKVERDQVWQWKQVYHKTKATSTLTYHIIILHLFHSMLTIS